jgi:hypothetical protein
MLIDTGTRPERQMEVNVDRYMDTTVGMFFPSFRGNPPIGSILEKMKPSGFDRIFSGRR